MVERFAATCQKAGIAGELHLTDGETARIISHQAAWQDLITINLAYRPGDNPISRLTHGFRVIMQRSPRPVLVVPQALTEARHALLAYDGSPGAREALYVATYISGHWGTQVSILTVSEESKKKSKASIAEAVNYLQDREVQATVLTSKLPVSQAILQSAHEVEADLIIMGGFSSPPLLGILLDTIADRVLRESQIPMLLCR
jgi:nucleotide-binding universal stress UspA family protein